MTKNIGKTTSLEKMATFIVDKRKVFYLVYVLLMIFSVFSTGWVNVNNDLTDYLSEETETRKGLTVMDSDFTTYGTAEVMIDNITYTDADMLCAELEEIEGVKEVAFDDTNDHYLEGAALFSVTFDGNSGDEICDIALSEIENHLSDYDTYVHISAENGSNLGDEMKIVMSIAVIIIVTVLLITSKSYMEVPVLLMTFGTAALLNKGTNFLFSEISFISNSVDAVLQLALAIDYAIILCHRYTEERETHEPREAVIQALTKAIPEISGSCMTTLSGLAAMGFMQFKIGIDMAVVLIKAILISIITVFTLMPGLLFSFSRLIDKTHHKKFLPQITAFTNIVVKLRYITPCVFGVVIVIAFLFSNNCPYAYSYTNIKTFRKNESQLAKQRIEETFSTPNTLAVVVPSGDYDKEQQLYKELDALDEVDSVLGIASVAVDEDDEDGYNVGDSLTPREFSEFSDMDIEIVRLLYSAYAAEHENYGRIVGGIDTYKISLIDMVEFAYKAVDYGYVDLDDEEREDLDKMYESLQDGKAQLESDNHTRLVMNLNISEESEETFEFLDKARNIAKKYYGDDVLLAGNATSNFDLSESFATDNIVINIISILFVLIVMVFTFQSVGIPFILILVIQGSIWINFSFPTILNSPVFFMSYLVVSSVQMGANIDYAIVMTSRYTEARKTMNKLDAIKEALELAFPTIFTSGTILASAGIAISLLCTDPAVSSIGVALGRGTITSIILVMLILPQLLVLGDFIIERTSFAKIKERTNEVKSEVQEIE